MDCPNLDFELGGAATVLEIPGLHHLIKHLLLDKIKKMFVRPNFQYFAFCNQVCSNESNVRQLDEPDGVLNITLVEAQHLVNKDSR